MEFEGDLFFSIILDLFSDSVFVLFELKQYREPARFLSP